jgi:hypothetical protein
MMQMRVVENDETGVPEGVCPLVIVMRRISELIDVQLVRLTRMAPDEIVRRSSAGSGARRRRTDVNVDLMSAPSKDVDQLRGTACDTRFHGRKGAEPGYPHAETIVIAFRG